MGEGGHRDWSKPMLPIICSYLTGKHWPNPYKIVMYCITKGTVMPPILRLLVTVEIRLSFYYYETGLCFHLRLAWKLSIKHRTELISSSQKDGLRPQGKDSARCFELPILQRTDSQGWHQWNELGFPGSFQPGNRCSSWKQPTNLWSNKTRINYMRTIKLMREI